jgi:serine/threonine protein kinase
VPGSYLYYAGLLLIVAWTCTLVRLTLPHATVATVATMLVYFLVAIWWNRTSALLVVNNMFFLTSAAIIGFGANYTMERYARTNFLQRRLIDSRTRELEEINAELVVKNRMLAESRAETLNAARRSEQIFSALSDALPGKVLDDKYRIAEKIGSGGFGTVYRGEHIFLHHPVAIKVFRPSVGHGSEESLDRFRREGISACRINHPNAVSVLDFDVSMGSLAYLVMELLRGRSLADELRSGRSLPPRRVAQIAASVYDALAAAHAAGIVHRDIKPSNVFLHQARGEEQVKVIDFGIAKLMDGDDVDRAQVTVAGTLVGTPAYMAPERLLGLDYDGRADVYSAGVMMYEMLSGRLPFESGKGEYWSVARMHLVESPPRLGALARGVPPELEAVVDRTMIKEPEQRPTAAEVATTLRSLRLA